jgi:hypothetical protein
MIVACALLSGSVFATVRYVDLNCTNATLSYTDWATAATNIQDAVDAATNGDLILVSNGVYQTGGRVVSLLPTNRVVIGKSVTVQSVNGPAVTVIQGNPQRGTNAIRCVYLTFGATLSGFTLTQGATSRPTGDQLHQDDGGGGVWCMAPINNMVTNCVLSNNLAAAGGGAYGCILNNCVVISNSVGMNGWSISAGGGAYFSQLTDCTLVGNLGWEGGGTYSSGLNNCILAGNSGWKGGGAYGGTLKNCTITANSATSSGGGTYGSTLQNCIVYDNNATSGTNYSGDTLNYCCILPLPDNGVGNITNGPLFVDQANGNLRLQSNSPCINAGNNASVTVTNDFEGNPRIVGGTVDIGAYECQSPALLACYIWLQNHGLPTDASAVYADSDGDGMNNWQEWRCDTNPTNSQSVLRMMSPVNDPGGILVQWQSTSTRSYFLERATNLASQPPFSSLASNIVGQAGTTSYTDTTATNGGPFFYRVGVQ